MSLTKTLEHATNNCPLAALTLADNRSWFLVNMPKVFSDLTNDKKLVKNIKLFL
jgi:hypothetical protein